MRAYFATILLLVAVGAHGQPTGDAALAESSNVRRDVQQDHVKTEIELQEEMDLQKNNLRPTVKCAEIVPEEGEPGEENHAACAAHCVALTEEYKHGKCLKGVCHCEQVLQSTDVVETHRKKESRGHPTVRCEHIHPDDGRAALGIHKACRAHCRSLGSGLGHGECVQGVCHCRKELRSAVPVAEPSLVHGKSLKCKHDDHAICISHCKTFGDGFGVGTCVDGICRCVKKPHSEHHLHLSVERHPTVRCEDFIPLHADLTLDHDEDQVCSAHCHTLGDHYIHGECLYGVCHCDRTNIRRRGSAGSVSHPTVKCVHIVPLLGHAGPENHDACSAHCRDIGRHYVEGKCDRGVCTCKKGVLVEAVHAVVPTTRI